MLKTIKLKLDTNKIPIWLFIISLVITLIIGVIKFTSLQNANKTLLQKCKTEYALTNKLKQKKNKTLIKEVKDAKSASFVQFTAEDLEADINKMYPSISKRVKHIITKSILTESNKYGINPLILYSLLHTESSMRPWIEHKRILIKIKDKKIYIRAVGLGGVVWEWWGNELKEAGIAEVRSDLFDPEVNIKAVAYIYNVFYNKKIHKKASTQDESAMIRYFGGGYKSYFEKIDKKVAQLIRQKLYR